jgi:hypothetical protein
MNPNTPNTQAARVEYFRRKMEQEVAQIEAAVKRAETNRRNAAKSTGPRTEEGKAASSKNRLSHGLCSSSLILHGESQADFDELRQHTHATFAPATPEESWLADQLVEATWRLNRARRVETITLDQINMRTANNVRAFNRSATVLPPDLSLATGLAEEAHQKTLSCILRYVAANERTYRACLKALQDAIKRRPQVAPSATETIADKPKVAAAGQCLYPEATPLTDPASTPIVRGLRRSLLTTPPSGHPAASEPPSALSRISPFSRFARSVSPRTACLTGTPEVSLRVGPRLA